MWGIGSELVASDSTTVVPAAGFGAKKPLGSSARRGTSAPRTQPLGSVIVSVWWTGSIAPVAPVQAGSPTSTTAACAGVALANTARPAWGIVPATASVSVPLPSTALLSSKRRLMAGTSPVRSVLGAAMKSRTWSPTAASGDVGRQCRSQRADAPRRAAADSRLPDRKQEGKPVSGRGKPPVGGDGRDGLAPSDRSGRGAHPLPRHLGRPGLG